MNPRLRTTLLVVLGVALGVLIGADVASEHYGVAVLAALVSAWLIVERSSAAPPDAWLLALIVVGYVVGNRGFAQMQPSPGLPLLPAEAVLLAAVPALVARMALKRAAGMRRDFLNFAVLGWMLAGALRLPLDMERFGVMALRDFATVYYALFFFIAQEFGASEGSASLLRRALTIAFVGLIPVVISEEVAPDFLIDHLRWRGIPIIYQKSDLIATSLAGGFFWLWTRRAKSGRRYWLALAAVSLPLVGAMASPRAAMAAIGLTTALWLSTGRWKIAAAQAGILGAAASACLAVVAFAGKDLKTSIPYSVYEHAVSMFDPEGTGTYINGDSGDPGGNNRFRLIWWRDVWEETLQTSPVFGVGFGGDLSARFLADYDLLTDETFAARNPHSIAMTVLGRMGILGLALWIAVSAGLARMAWRLFRAGEADGLGLASVVCVIWVSAHFGVVLEGPMGAVVFWTAAGLANACALKPGAAVDREKPEAKADWPIAKSHALDT